MLIVKKMAEANIEGLDSISGFDSGVANDNAMLSIEGYFNPDYYSLPKRDRYPSEVATNRFHEVFKDFIDMPFWEYVSKVYRNGDYNIYGAIGLDEAPPFDEISEREALLNDKFVLYLGDKYLKPFIQKAIELKSDVIDFIKSTEYSQKGKIYTALYFRDFANYFFDEWYEIEEAIIGVKNILSSLSEKV